MFIQLTEVTQLTLEEVIAELKTKEAEGDGQNIGGVTCYDISDQAARTIATTYGARDTSGHQYLWMLGNGDLVGPEYVHDDIDHILSELLYESEDSDSTGARLLKALKGWLYLQVAKTLPSDGVQVVPEEFQLKVSSVSVADLIGRNIENRHGAQFKIVDARYHLQWGKVYFDLVELDEEDGEVIPHSENGIFTLEGWTVL